MQKLSVVFWFFRTEVVKNTLNPVWKTFSVPVQSLCAGDDGRKIKVCSIYICSKYLLELRAGF